MLVSNGTDTSQVKFQNGEQLGRSALGCLGCAYRTGLGCGGNCGMGMGDTGFDPTASLTGDISNDISSSGYSIDGTTSSGSGVEVPTFLTNMAGATGAMPSIQQQQIDLANVSSSYPTTSISGGIVPNSTGSWTNVITGAMGDITSILGKILPSGNVTYQTSGGLLTAPVGSLNASSLVSSATSSLSSYLPIILLGGGALLLVSVMGKR